MTAYVIFDIDIKDPAVYKQYAALAPQRSRPTEGRYLARGGHVEKLEGDWTPKRLVILQFESVERAKQWLDSPEYTPVKRLRHQAASSNMVVIEGV